ncbi:MULTISPECIES: STAS domain-containing protein [unclassified Streptomyces]|uniref:STAS domain-containing protein n=1 Tax=unclassified Streptomyces TaxID=2593676 RepID=UPI002E28054A|nr:STAS domain-containing protein [Streptomyces sp. NBC_00273]
MGGIEDREGPTQEVWEDGEGLRLIGHVGGEMDIDRAPMLSHALHAAITRPGGPEEIVIDMSDLSFCDSAGLSVLIGARRTAAEHGRRITLRGQQPQFLRLLDVTGATGLFQISGT